MRSWLLLVVATGCWRGGAEPAETTPAPSPRKSRVRVALPVPQIAILAKDMPDVLRNDPARVLSSLGPIVALDLQTNVVSTLCDRDAADAQREWQALLSDPARSKPRCTERNGITCVQSGGTYLIITFSDDEERRPLSVIHGSAATGLGSSAMPRVLSALQSASCP